MDSLVMEMDCMDGMVIRSSLEEWAQSSGAGRRLVLCPSSEAHADISSAPLFKDSA